MESKMEGIIKKADHKTGKYEVETSGGGLLKFECLDVSRPELSAKVEWDPRETNREGSVLMRDVETGDGFLVVF